MVPYSQFNRLPNPVEKEFRRLDFTIIDLGDLFTGKNSRIMSGGHNVDGLKLMGLAYKASLDLWHPFLLI